MPPVLLPQRDRDYLESKEMIFTLSSVGAEVHLTLHEFVFPEAYVPMQSDLRIVLPPGYDSANPDMFWTRPSVKLLSGALPLTADYMQTFADGVWQRWSRHFEGWRPGVDGLRSYVASIRRELSRGL
ncbi:hypothetical protein BH09GEM1_BH09GEM1_22640 [soil metagenome]